MNKNLRKKISLFPHNAGCYIMKDAAGTVLYIGKAKDLRKRVTSYWRARDVKTYALVQEIADIEYILTTNEVEALILEAQLIQQSHPKYNIDLQSTGRYAYIKITDEMYPRLVIARALEKKGVFIGPYTSAAARNEAVRSAYRLFRLCKRAGPKAKPCFRYYLGYCSGVCAGVISSAQYKSTIQQVKKFLRGDFLSLINETREQMARAAFRQKFEKAKVYRDRLRALETLNQQGSSRAKSYDQDVINGIFLESNVRIQVFHFHRSIISGRKEFTFDPSCLARSAPEKILFDFMSQYYQSHDIPHEIIIPFRIEQKKVIEKLLSTLGGHAVFLTVPVKGKKKDLLELVKKNLASVHGDSKGQLLDLQEELRLPRLPIRIACVDISTLGGTNTVGSLVQFLNGQPWKSGYRRFKIQSVRGVNDTASIEELITRFCARVKNGKEQSPDLLVIDGGKGQLSSAKKALAMQGANIPLIALAKRFEEIYTTWSPYPLLISRRKSCLQLLRALRDEAHRFAITYQRKKRKYGKGRQT